MQFTSPLRPATLLKRYKRFLADVVTPEGTPLTLHCANTGAMTGCATPGDTVWYSTSTVSTRKYPHSWELTETAQGEWICVNTLRANQIVKEALEQQRIPELTGYKQCLSEVRYGEENSRIDFLLRSEHGPDCYIEVKSVTLLEQGQGYFPDAVTLRGQKHLRELSLIRQSGHRAVLLFAVLHSGIRQVCVAKQIDPTYAQLLEQARQNGVEVLCYTATLSVSEISLFHPLPFSAE